MYLHWLNDQFLYVRPRNHKRRIHHAVQAPDGCWYGMVHFNHRYIRVGRVSRNVWIPVEAIGPSSGEPKPNHNGRKARR